MYPGPDPRYLPRVPEPNLWQGYPPPPQIQTPPPPYPAVVNVHVPRAFNHLPHLIGDFFTCGMWLPVHLMMWAMHKG